MRLRELPLIAQVFESGPNDRVFDGLLLAGPLLIALIALLGRSVVTTGIGVLYLLTFALYVVYNGVR